MKPEDATFEKLGLVLLLCLGICIVLGVIWFIIWLLLTGVGLMAAGKALAGAILILAAIWLIK
jgi:hypothetical protein